MTAPISDRDRGRMLLWLFAVCLVAGALIWVLWVLPTQRSVAEAEVAESGATLTVRVSAGERLGVWTESAARHLGTFACTADGPAAVSAWRGPTLTWDDTLWWASGRSGFAQTMQLRFPVAGAYTVSCADSRDVYGGGFVVAGDAFGDHSVGLGRQGASGFAIGTVLAVSAVGAPLLTLALLPVFALRALRRRSRARPGSAFGAADDETERGDADV